MPGTGNNRICRVIKAGTLEYDRAHTIQKRLVRQRANGSIPDTLLVTSHPPVYTIGRRGNRSEILATEGELHSMGVSVVNTDRGGAVTYHGPGQVVLYPVLHLNIHGMDVHRLINRYEQVIIETLSKWGIRANRVPEYPGVWVQNRKICAVGIGVTRRVSYHGLALNVNTNLDYFDKIVPCGISHLGVTSMQRELGYPVNEEKVITEAIYRFGVVFNLRMVARGMDMVSVQ